MAMQAVQVWYVGYFREEAQRQDSDRGLDPLTSGGIWMAEIVKAGAAHDDTKTIAALGLGQGCPSLKLDMEELGFAMVSGTLSS